MGEDTIPSSSGSGAKTPPSDPSLGHTISRGTVKIKTPSWVKSVGIGNVGVMTDRVIPFGGLLILSWGHQGRSWKVGQVPPYTKPWLKAKWRLYTPGECVLCRNRIFTYIWNGEAKYKPMHRPKKLENPQEQLGAGIELMGSAPFTFCTKCWIAFGHQYEVCRKDSHLETGCICGRQDGEWRICDIGSNPIVTPAIFLSTRHQFHVQDQPGMTVPDAKEVLGDAWNVPAIMLQRKYLGKWLKPTEDRTERAYANLLKALPPVCEGAGPLVKRDMLPYGWTPLECPKGSSLDEQKKYYKCPENDDGYLWVGRPIKEVSPRDFIIETLGLHFVENIYQHIKQTRALVTNKALYHHPQVFGSKRIFVTSGTLPAHRKDKEEIAVANYMELMPIVTECGPRQVPVQCKMLYTGHLLMGKTEWEVKKLAMHLTFDTCLLHVLTCKTLSCKPLLRATSAGYLKQLWDRRRLDTRHGLKGLALDSALPPRTFFKHHLTNKAAEKLKRATGPEGEGCSEDVDLRLRADKARQQATLTQPMPPPSVPDQPTDSDSEAELEEPTKTKQKPKAPRKSFRKSWSQLFRKKKTIV